MLKAIINFDIISQTMTIINYMNFNELAVDINYKKIIYYKPRKKKH